VSVVGDAVVRVCPVVAVAVAVVVGTVAAQCCGADLFERSAAIDRVYDTEHTVVITARKHSLLCRALY